MANVNYQVNGEGDLVKTIFESSIISDPNSEFSDVCSTLKVALDQKDEVAIAEAQANYNAILWVIKK